jgi:predicted permease
VLLTGAALLMKSLASLYSVDLGYRAENVLVMKASGVRSLRENNVFFTDLLMRIATLPGVVSIGATSTPPGEMANAGSGSYFIDRKPVVRDLTAEPEALFTIVAPGSFSAMGVPLKVGRDFDAGDLFDRPLVAIVNEALVRRSLRGQNPIGRTIYCNFDRGNDPMTIVGVVGDVRQRNPALEPMPECYMPYRQHSYNNATLYVVTRTAGDPLSLAASVRKVAAEVSPNVPVSFSTLEAMTAEGVAAPRFRSLLFVLFAGLALCLAMAGVYGVVAYSVEQRAREIGIRMAIGASGQSVLRLILGQGVALAAVGLVAGLAGATAATRLLESVLFQVQPFDVQVYLAVVLLLALVTLAAGYIPARRAARVDPMQLLKSD